MNVREIELKTLPEFFEAVKRGDKTFEVRKADRDFQVGDKIILREWHGEYTGKRIARIISYILPGGQYGIRPCYCVLGLRRTKGNLKKRITRRDK